mmetsp:Transcript_16513/g.24182  ORF Transcript_16513/g.24182 Transcript_16513/m.24182 type:complete len:1178 (-) Transcript_16513:277-3810(-)
MSGESSIKLEQEQEHTPQEMHSSVSDPSLAANELPSPLELEMGVNMGMDNNKSSDMSMDLDMNMGMDIDDHMNTKMKMEMAKEDHDQGTTKEIASPFTVTTRPHSNSDLTRTPSPDPFTIITAATPTTTSMNTDAVAVAHYQQPTPRLSVPDPIGSSVSWSNTNIANSTPAPVRSGGMHPATVRLAQHPAATTPATSAVSAVVAPAQASAIAASAASAATRHIQIQQQLQQKSLVGGTPGTATATATSVQAQAQKPLVQIASRGGIRHNIIGVQFNQTQRQNTTPVSASAPVAPVQVPSSSANQLTSGSIRMTAVTNPISGTSATNTINAQPIAITIPTTNPNNQSGTEPLKKSPRLEGMTDKGQSSSITKESKMSYKYYLSLPDPMSFRSVPDACSSSISANTSMSNNSGSTAASMPGATALVTPAVPAHTTNTVVTAPVSAASAAILNAQTAKYVPVQTTSATNAPKANSSPATAIATGSTHSISNLNLGGPAAPTTIMSSGPSQEVHLQDDGGDEVLPDRKQKRLQRNRESARLSRRRRKQYLEVLEERVNFLCEEMDRGRREHVLSALRNIGAMRAEVLTTLMEAVKISAANGNQSSNFSSELYQKMNMLLDYRDDAVSGSGFISRMSQELMLAITFGKQYLLSLVIPPSKKYLMWLTLQNDIFFRGGRAASERLSAARIGEKLRSCGHTRVPPSNGMWPLFCNEVSLSYDQEEKIRSLQKEVLAKQETWLHRHTGASSEHILQSAHDAIHGAASTTEKRGKRLLDVLTPEQKVRFIAWIAKKKKEDGQKVLTVMNACKMASSSNSPNDDFEPNDKCHDSANLYILNHKLSMIAQKFKALNAKSMSGKALKKFTRRPAFESLATMEDTKGSGGKKGGGKDSGSSLKRCSSELSLDDGGGFMKKSASGTSLCGTGNTTLTPEAAQNTCSSHVYATLGPISAIIPSHRLARQKTVTAQFATSNTFVNEIPLMPNHTNMHQQVGVTTAVVAHHPTHVGQILQTAPTILQPQHPHPHAVIPQIIPSATTGMTSNPTVLPDSIASSSQGTTATITTTTMGATQQPFTFTIPDPVPVLPFSNLATQHGNVPQPMAIATSPLVKTDNNNMVVSQSAPALNSLGGKVPSPLGQPMQSVKEEVPTMPLDEDVNFWGVSNQLADDSLFDLAEENWAIGEQIFF